MDLATPAAIRIAFLREFMKRVMLSEKPGLFDIMEKESEKPLLEEFTVQPINLQIARAVREEFIQSEKMIISQSIQSPQIVKSSQIQPISPPKAIEINIPPAPSASSIFDRIIALISNPYIMSVECAQANKPLMINKQGMIQPSEISPSDEEIKSFLQEISKRTKIPLLPGVFKVAYQNFNITAFVSEFVGSKFLIQKKPAAPAYRPQYRF